VKKIGLLSIFLVLAACSGRKNNHSAQASVDQINCLNSLKQPGVVKTAEDNSIINKYCIDSSLNKPDGVKCAHNALYEAGGDVKVLNDVKSICSMRPDATESGAQTPESVDNPAGMHDTQMNP